MIAAVVVAGILSCSCMIWFSVNRIESVFFSLWDANVFQYLVVSCDCPHTDRQTVNIMIIFFIIFETKKGIQHPGDEVGCWICFDESIF